MNNKIKKIQFKLEPISNKSSSELNKLNLNKYKKIIYKKEGIYYLHIKQNANNEDILFKLRSRDLDNLESLKNNKKKLNLQTIIFEKLFVSNEIEKLLEKAKIIYRPALLPKIITHPKGSILVNKIMANGEKIEIKKYTQVYKYVNGKSKTITKHLKELLNTGKIITHIANYDIIKNKRFTEEQYTIVIPI